MAQAGQPLEVVHYGDHEACTRLAHGMIDVARQFKGLLTGEG
jgi:hypothetical protein